INDAGVVVGITSATLAGPPRPTRWIRGVAEGLGTLGGPGGYAYAINRDGTIVGNAAPALGAPHAFRFAGGSMSSLGTIAGHGSGALSINDEGWAVGFYYTAPSSTARQAVIWRPGGGWILPGALGSGPSSAYGINASGLVVGVSQAADGNDHAVRYDAAGTRVLEDLGTGWGTRSIAYGVNDDGWIVGAIAGAKAPARAFLWVDGDFHDLNAGLLGAEGWTVTSARSINSRGWIAGGAINPAGAPRAVLLLPRAASASALVNFSIRAGLQPDRPVIAGLSVGGIGGRILVARGVGPGLVRLLPATVTAATDTRITVFDKAGLPEAANDDWVEDAALDEACTEVGAFALAPGSRDAAMLHGFVEQRTIHLESTDTGVGLVEVYDTRRTSNLARLVNLSARYHVGSGDEVLIAGFAIEGTAPKALLIRGVGPGLAGRVSGHLLDARLVVYDGDGRAIAENDDWPANLASVFSAVSAFGLPAGSKDAALVVSLPPGTYTVHLSGEAGETGEGLIEVYDLDL
ncbi:MAG: hypothetical protein IAE82_02205, partial [Opitutaceae bacterium]|nr:hypothetical protein [Opitutaceae bacterium]